MTARKADAIVRQEWTPDLDRLILSGPNLTYLSDKIGRTTGAISTRQSVLRRAADETLREDVRRSWGTERPSEISSRNHVTDNVVHYIAHLLDLGPPVRFGDMSAAVMKARNIAERKPGKPSGYTDEQIKWAKRYERTSREAKMMLVMHNDHPRVAGE